MESGIQQICSASIAQLIIYSWQTHFLATDETCELTQVISKYNRKLTCGVSFDENKMSYFLKLSIISCKPSEMTFLEIIIKSIKSLSAFIKIVILLRYSPACSESSALRQNNSGNIIAPAGFSIDANRFSNKSGTGLGKEFVNTASGLIRNTQRDAR